MNLLENLGIHQDLVTKDRVELHAGPSKALATVRDRSRRN